MTSKSPIFPIAEAHHFSDYGFDPQFDYFQVLEEARKHKRDTFSSKSIIDTLHFQLEKPISLDDMKRFKKNNKRAKWWRNALFFFKSKWVHARNHRDRSDPTNKIGPHCGRAYTGSISGPVYVTESLSGGSTPYRTASRPSSGPLTKGDLDLPYISLRELNTEPPHRIPVSAMPIYLVT